MRQTESQLESAAVQQEELHVTKSFLPPLSEYVARLEQIWESGWLTNNGALLQEFEAELQERCESPHLIAVTNGTIALQLAIKAFGLSKQVITTPFSYVATTSSLVWEQCEPVFADIDPHTYNIDPGCIENLITADTEAILATHVFGNPCDVERIQAIADKHGLKVIYDAAHAFNVKYKGQQLVNYGELSTLSFHATKLFHSVEGGAIITKDPELLNRLKRMRNFGHDGPGNFTGAGINGKVSEFHAAMGLVNLKHLPQIRQSRADAWKIYYDAFAQVDGIQLQRVPEGTVVNHAYFSVVFDSEEVLLRVRNNLADAGIFPKRYFYPALHTLDYVSGDCPVADDISKRVLCLPFYAGIQAADQERVINITRSSLSS